MNYFAILLAAFMVVGVAGAGDIYVTTDARGQKIYTDSPQAVPALKLELRDQSAPSDKGGNEVASMAERDDQRQTLGSGAKSLEADQAMIEDRAEQCEEARRRYDMLMSSLRVYTLDSNGEPHFLTVEQMSEARVKAKQFLDKFCMSKTAVSP